MFNLKQILKAHYYKYQPGEFLPIFQDGILTNRRAFHIYRITWIIKNRRAAYYSFTHYAA